MTPADVRARAIARAVVEVPGVVALHGGRFGSVGTYLAAERITGVRIGDDGSIDVHVTLQRDAPILATARRVRAAVALLEVGPINITIEDLA